MILCRYDSRLPAAVPTFCAMFVRKTATRNKSTNESCHAYRLVASERVGKQVRQITLLNLGRHFDLPPIDRPGLCARIDAPLAGHVGLLAESEAIETLARRYAARLIARLSSLQSNRK